MDERLTQHPHAPPHLFRPGATYCLTARTVHREPVLADDQRKQELLEALRFAAAQRGWTVVAWVILSNHYHCLLQAPEEDADSLPALLTSAHSYTARKWNHEDQTPGRKVWYQYWDTCLTYERSFFARLNYIHHNPVRHGLVAHPSEYPHSSYQLWEQREDVDLDTLALLYPWSLLDLEASA